MLATQRQVRGSPKRERDVEEFILPISRIALFNLTTRPW